MRLKPKHAWFLAFTAVFAALAGFVFWGTWSLDMVPVMPDAEICYPHDHAYRCLRSIMESCKFHPLDVRNLLGIPYFWQELRYVMSLYLAALGMVYFCRGRGLGRLASYGAGLLLGFCGYWATLYSAGHFGWFQWMSYGIFAFGLADRAVRKNKLKNWLLLGAVVSWAGFNQQDLWLFFTLFTSVYFLWCCFRERRFPWKGMVIAVAVFTVIGIPNFVDVFSNVVQGRKTQMASGENITDQNASKEDQCWEFVTNWSMPPEDAVEFFVPRVHGDTSCPFVLSISSRLGNGIKPYTGRLGRPMNASAGNYRQHSLYVGRVTCFLVLVSLLAFFTKRWKCVCRRDLAFFSVAAAVFFLLSLGRFCEPVYRMIFALPFGSLIRCPVKWHHLTEFCLVFMSGCGIEILSRYAENVRLRIGRVNPAVAALACLVVWGAVDLAIEDKRYCAPINVKTARKSGSSVQLSVLSRSDFSRPQVAQMVNAGQIFSIANYMGNPDYYLVGVLSRYGVRKGKDVPPLLAFFGILSVLTTLGVGAFAVRASMQR